MKSKLSLLLLAVFFFVACCKDDAEEIVGCAADALMTTVNHNVFEENAREVIFNVLHTDDSTISSVDWNFGDGTTQTSNSKTITHAYAEAGSYHVKLTVYLSNSCSFDKTKNITVH